MGVRSLWEVGYPKGVGARSNGGEKPMGGGISKGGEPGVMGVRSLREVGYPKGGGSQE